jgi:ribosomal protein S18 acetylase RimI-like enzyme
VTTEVNYSLRQATKNDIDFLRDLHWSAMKEYVAQTWRWDEEFQRQMFADQFDASQYQIIVVDGRDVGAMSVHRHREEIEVADIKLVTDFQRQGIGTAVIQDILKEAAAGGFAVGLQVLKVNPARSLYERLGFDIVSESDTHFGLEARPAHESATSAGR